MYMHTHVHTHTHAHLPPAMAPDNKEMTCVGFFLGAKVLASAGMIK